MNYNSLGKAARNEFYESRLKEKNIQLLETIPKLRKAPRKRNKIWLKKQLDFYVILTMLAYEVSMSKFLWVMYEMPPTCFYLKRSFIRKPNKSELTNELKNMITKNIPTHLLPVIDYRFHDSARKVPIKKQNLKTYSDFFISPCSAFFPSHTIRWTLFLICTKKTASKQVSNSWRYRNNYFRF